MQTATQALAHRAQITRTKPRWQPYASTPTQVQHLASPTIGDARQLPTLHELKEQHSEFNRSSQLIPPTNTATTTPSSLKEPARDSNKTKFASGLVDQTVKLLNEVWRPEIIPSTFRPPLPNNSSAGPIDPVDKLRQIYGTPLNQSTPLQTQSGEPLLPIRPFVHEVLRRSRTSGTVLQTALCYLEAIRHKVADIAVEERAGIHSYFQPESRIMRATEAELAREAELAQLERDLEEDICSEFLDYNDVDMTVNSDYTQSTLSSPGLTVLPQPGAKTIKVLDEHHPDNLSDNDEHSSFVASSTAGSTATLSTPPTSLLEHTNHTSLSQVTSSPSPLLCPRRAFLASLVLATKFSQDKCYSNRAWAKLSGLSAREIGRCERALGQVLDWRLWVGKKSPSPSPPSTRPVARSQSESSIVSTPALRETFFTPTLTTTASGDALVDRDPQTDSLVKRQRQPIRRSSTLPVDAFMATPQASSNVQAPSTITQGYINNMGVREPNVMPNVSEWVPNEALDRTHGNSTLVHPTPEELTYFTVRDVPHQTGLVKVISVKQTLGISSSSSSSQSCVFSNAPGQMKGQFTQSPKTSSVGPTLSSSPDTPSPPSLTFSPSATDISSGTGSQVVSINSTEDALLTSYNPSQPWTNFADKCFLAVQEDLVSGKTGTDNKSGCDVPSPLKAIFRHRPPPVWTPPDSVYQTYEQVDVY